MESKKLKSFEDQLSKIKPFLPQYLKEMGYDVEHGHKIRCLNPEHDDRTPSMSMFETDKGYPLLRCNGCETIVDIFTAAHIVEGRPIVGPGFIQDTVPYLADKYGIEIAFKNLTEEEVYELNMYQAYAAVSKYIISQTDFNDMQIQEFEKRQIEQGIAQKYLVGICNNLEDMRRHLNGLGFMNSFIDEIDLTNKNIFNSHSVIYTICDDYGRPVAFMARNLLFDGVTDEETGRLINGAKFIGSKTSLRKNIYKKNERLYLLHFAKKVKKPIYIVEGNSDALSLHSHGIENAVGICGLGLSDLHLNTLRRNSCYDIIICLDNDNPGKAKARKILDDVLNRIHDIKVRFVFLPKEYDNEGNELKTDPDEFIRNHGVDAFLALDKIEPFAWRLEQFDEDQTSDNEFIAETMIPVIISEPSSLRRETMISQLSLFTGFSEKSIRDEIKKIENSESLRIASSKKAVVSKLIDDISNGKMDAEILLNSALNDLHEINTIANSNTLDTNTRVNRILSVKEYEEDESHATPVFLGDDMKAFSASIEGDIAGKVVYIGGASNVGKTAQIINLLWRIVSYNDDVCCPFLSIDDSEKDIIPRMACFDASYDAYLKKEEQVLNSLNINKFAKPQLYKDSIQYEIIMDYRNKFFDKLLEFTREDKIALFDSTDGRSISFVESILRNYREKFPNRRLIFFLDNFHLLQLDSDQDGREKYKTLSHELKALSIKYSATVISSVEYTKMPMDQEPTNNNIAESVALVYDSNLIWHGFNELHGLREKALSYFHDNYGNQYPIVKFAAGKNKIAAFKGNAYFKFYPEKSLYVEISEETFKQYREANNLDQIQAPPPQ